MRYFSCLHKINISSVQKTRYFVSKKPGTTDISVYVPDFIGLHNSEQFPGPEPWRGLLKGHGPPVCGMEKAQSFRPESNITAVVQEAVFPVPHQWQTVMGKLTANLMGAARDELYAHKAQAVLSSKAAIVQLCLLHSLGGGQGDIAFALGLVAIHKVFKAALIEGSAVDHGQIALSKVSLPYLPGKLRCRITATGQHHKAADHPVKAVDSAHIGSFVAQFIAHKLRQASGLIG